jgi:hypothetical protein
MERQPTDDDDDDFLKHLIPCEEDRQRLAFPRWEGGYRWFKASNVVALEQVRRRRARQSTPDTSGSAPAA